MSEPPTRDDSHAPAPRPRGHHDGHDCDHPHHQNLPYQPSRQTDNTARVSLRVAVIASLSVATGVTVGALAYLAFEPTAGSPPALVALSVLTGLGVIAGAFAFFDRVIH